MEIKTREGDFIENVGQIVFDVKGLMHPRDKKVAFPRFLPDSSGDRKRDNMVFGKVYSLSDRFEFLEQNLPSYLVYDPVFDEILCEVPASDLAKHYVPIEKLQDFRTSECLDKLETKALRMTTVLEEETGVPQDAVGISGSLLVGLHTANSDLDPVVYGSENCQRVFRALKSLREDCQSGFKRYSPEKLRELFDFRSKDTLTSFEDFVRTESGKVMQGLYDGTDYFLRFVKSWDEITESYGEVRYSNCGYARIKATIEDDRESIFTPCTYRITDVRVLEGESPDDIEEISSFRGRFCEQAKNGETVVAQGKIERVVITRQNHGYYRMLLGNKPTDFMTRE